MQVTIKSVVHAIGPTPDRWVGNCYATAYLIHSKKLVKGILRYGHYHGPIIEGTLFAERSKHTAIIHHGWIEKPDGMIFDPTRWVFFGNRPWLFEGQDIGGEYDPGGNILRAQNVQPPPSIKPDSLRSNIVFPALDVDAFCRVLCGNPLWLTTDHLFWIANLPINMLHEYAEVIYRAIAYAGYKAWIPLDNWNIATCKGSSDHTATYCGGTTHVEATVQTD